MPRTMSLDYTDLELFLYVVPLKRPSHSQHGECESSSALGCSEMKSKCEGPDCLTLLLTMMSQQRVERAQTLKELNILCTTACRGFTPTPRHVHNNHASGFGSSETHKHP